MNKQIRVPKVRVIDQDGKQLGVVTTQEALSLARDAGLDLVEIVPNSSPPVCKIIDYGKFRYDQTKRERESKKGRQQTRVKEIKVKPNIDEHDLETKLRHARNFLSKGNKVKVTCFFRGRENIHPEIGEALIKKMCESLEDVATMETSPKKMGRTLITVLAPGGKKKTSNG